MHGGALWPISDQSYLLIMRYVIVMIMRGVIELRDKTYNITNGCFRERGSGELKSTGNGKMKNGKETENWKWSD